MKNIISQQAREVPLDIFCLSLARTYLHKPSALDGARMAVLTQRLIAAESQPGGPYYNKDHVLDFPTNLAIAYLFACLEVPLPNLAHFITTHRSSAPSSTAKLLLAYDQVLKNQSKKSLPVAPEHHAIYATTKKHLAKLPLPEKPLALAFLKKIRQADASQEIALLPTFFAGSLISPPKNMPLEQLGEANIHCWISYSIYDSLMDDEPAASLLPIANITMRKSLQLYQTLFSKHPLFLQTILSTFMAMDHANAWETAHCRFKRVGENITITELPRYSTYSILADRCSGHILGPLGITILCDVSTDKYASIEKGLRHYLIARQLSDDIHDWKEDFTAGHASSTVTYLLQQLKTQPGTHSFASLSNLMQEVFWQSSMETFTKIIVRHLDTSRHHLLQSGLLKKNGPLFALHDRLEAVASHSLSEYHSSKAFLENYGK